jgi:membrane fusion protein (multidrug efflux system)
MSKRTGTWLLVGLIVFFIVEGYRYIHYRQVNAVSDAAFVRSDKLAVLSFKVDGKVVRLTKKEGQKVKKGELIGHIDERDFVTAKNELEKKAQALDEKIEALRLRIKRSARALALKSDISAQNVEAVRRRIEAAKLRIAAARTRLAKLTSDAERYGDLAVKRLIAQERYEEIRTQEEALRQEIDAMQEALKADESALQKAQKAYALAKSEQSSIEELEKELAASIADRKSLDAKIDAIRQHIDDTYLYAPFDGSVAKKFFDAPRVIEAGTPVYAVVDPKRLHIEVLLSEKKLRGVKIGCDAEVTADALPDRTFKGKVTAIAPVSAATFSLVPRDIASGEFTKLDQRFVVRIDLDDISGLRTGMGANVAIRKKE